MFFPHMPIDILVKAEVLNPIRAFYRMENYMRRMSLKRRVHGIAPTLIVLAVIAVVLYFQGAYRAHTRSLDGANQSSAASAAYLYYTLKQPTGFVLARAPEGSNGQPLSNPQQVAKFGN